MNKDAVRDYYTVARVACKKVGVSSNLKEDCIQYIVMKLWEDDLDEHINFKKLVTFACNKAKDYLRSALGDTRYKDNKRNEVLTNDGLNVERVGPHPEDTIIKKLDLKRANPTMTKMIEEFIVNGKTMKEYGKEQGITEGRVSQIFKDEVAKYANTKRKIK